MDWLKAAPYMEPFVNCLAANRVLHYTHPSLAQQVWSALSCLNFYHLLGLCLPPAGVAQMPGPSHQQRPIWEQGVASLFTCQGPGRQPWTASRCLT